MNNFEKYKHSHNIHSKDYYSNCNQILKKFRNTENMYSNQYYYYVVKIIEEYNDCKKNEM